MALHFLRPAWLLVLLPGLLLPLCWHHAQDLERRLRGTIAPHLLPALLVHQPHRRALRPAHLLGLLWLLGALAAAGPTWRQQPTPLLDNQALLLIAVDLSTSMDASDVAPSRLEAAKQKILQLLAQRRGARTALLAYAGSAHVVLPPTDDAALLQTFVQALGSGLVERPGKDVLGVIAQARTMLGTPPVPATLLLITDGADAGQFDALAKALDDSGLQALVLAVGNADGGIIRDANGQPRTDSDGRPQLGSFDQAGLQQLATSLDAPLTSLAPDASDLAWVQQQARSHFEQASVPGQPAHWLDAGYWLCWPLALLALLAVRKGWSLNWVGLLLVLFLAPSPARAGGLADAFLTADQQGRWAFEHGHYPAAAAAFHDPYWKGIAAYRAVDYDLALASFARLDTPEAYFYLGNIYTRRYRFDQAIAAYRRALALRPAFSEASANLALALALQQDNDSAQHNGPDIKADEVRFDQHDDHGKSLPVQTAQAASDALWLQNLSTSPAPFLKNRFRLEDQARQGATP